MAEQFPNKMPSSEWSKGSIEGQYTATLDGPGMKREGRSLEEYAKDLGFSISDLEGKIVLDLGAGPTARLERELEGKAHVVSVSPDYSLPEHASRIEGRNALAALGQALPFKEGAFDTVLAYHVTEHIHSGGIWTGILKESLRVLKPGGTLYLMPILSNSEIEELTDTFVQDYGNVSLTWEDTGKRLRNGSRFEYTEHNILRAKLQKHDLPESEQVRSV